MFRFIKFLIILAAVFLAVGFLSYQSGINSPAGKIDKEVVFISKNNQPCENGKCSRVNTDRKAKYVLELNKGITDKIGLEVGDEANFNIE